MWKHKFGPQGWPERIEFQLQNGSRSKKRSGDVPSAYTSNANGYGKAGHSRWKGWEWQEGATGRGQSIPGTG
jgi:hypothetical protein